MTFWERATKCFVFLALLSPLVVGLQSFIFPFIVPKILFFRTVVELALLCYGMHLWQQGNWKISLQPLTMITAAFVFIAFLSGIFGVDFHQSFWSDFERMEGVFTLLHCLVYMWLLTRLFRTREDWQTFLMTLTGVSVLVILSGVMQRFASPTDPFLTIGGGRVYGTLGNFIYYGQYCVFTFWIAALLAVWAKTRAWRVGYGVVMLLASWGIFLAASRGPMVGWFASMVVCAGVCAFFFSNRKIRIGGMVIGVGIVALLLVAIFGNVGWMNRINGLGGLRDIANISGTASTRLMAWNIAWHGFLERPILGWGWGNYYVIYNKLYDPHFLEHGWGETWFDHAHNQYFDMLSTTGALGFLAYVGIFGTAVWLLIHAVRQKQLPPLSFAVLLSLLVAHAVNNVFVFEHPSSYLLFFILLGLIQAETQRNKGVSKAYHLPIGATRGAIVVIGLFVAVLGYQGNYLGWKANRSDRDFQVMFQTDPAGSIANLISLAEVAGPYRRDVRNNVGQTILLVERPEVGTQPAAIYTSILKQVAAVLEKNQAEFPYDVRHAFVLSDIYKNLYFMGEQDALNTMEAMYMRLQTLSPARQQVYYNWAEVRLLAGKTDEAIELVKKTLTPDMHVPDGYWLLAKIEGSRGRWTEAKAYLEQARSHGLSPTEEMKALIRIIENEGKVTST